MRLFGAVVAILAPAGGGARRRCDARIRRVMELVEERPFDETSLSVLAREVGLSESRLRDLFRKTLGCPLSQYARWVAAWKAIRLWKKGMTFTDVAHAVGFHDLAHADHALGETFGMSPSEMCRIDLQRCGGDARRAQAFRTSAPNKTRSVACWTPPPLSPRRRIPGSRVVRPSAPATPAQGEEPMRALRTSVAVVATLVLSPCRRTPSCVTSVFNGRVPACPSPASGRSARPSAS